MKLKKFAAMMLAGVMAVSMLAGCSTGIKPEEPTEEPTGDSTIATYLTDAQNDKNDVQVAFTYDNGIENVMNRAFELYGDSIDGTDLENAVAHYLDADAQVTELSKFYGYDDGQTDRTEDSKAGTQTFVKVYKVEDNRNVEQIAKDIMTVAVNGNFDVTLGHMQKEATINNDKIDCTYTYAGKAAMVTVNTESDIDRYVAVVMTCTTATALAD